ncbi:hypothetical protein M9435_000275 [Picochlorum sp. BPE23]|nr:hypothetical protein M9435_000275 [Picochlorum sp. BPE23]
MEDTIHMLQNRIHQDKQQLKHLQSLLYPSSTAYEAPKVYTEPYMASEGLYVRTNPVFQSTFDAMDTYDDDHMHRRTQDPAKRATHHQTATTTEGRHHAMQHLFHQCRKRIGRAEKLLDRASSEKSIRMEIASLRQCIELCLDEMKHRQAADERLTRILQDHIHDVVLGSSSSSSS